MSWLLRLLLGEGGFGRISVGAAMVIALGGGLGAYYVVTTAPAAGSANIWVDTSGGTCARSSTPGAYVDASACASLTAAYNAASGGDTINVRCGTYTSQTIPQRSLGTTYTTIQKDPGDGSCTQVNVASSGGHLDIFANYVIVDGLSSNPGTTEATLTYFQLGDNLGCAFAYPSPSWPCAMSNNHVQFKNWKFTQGALHTDQLLLQHGEIGGINGQINACDAVTHNGIEDGIVAIGEGNGASAESSPVPNLTVDDVYFHDMIVSGCGNHVDGIQGFGYKNWLIKNSRFKNLPTCILAYSQNNANPLDIDGMTVENSMFEDTGSQSHCITIGNDGTQLCGSSNLNNIVQNNTFISGLRANVQCSGSPDGIFRNNLDYGATEACGFGNQDWSWNYNTWKTPASGCAATSNSSTCTPSFQGGGAPTATSVTGADLSSSDTCAKNYVPPTGGTFPATDIHATSRPQGTNVDAGVMEVVGG
jgi:hypothetical protein